MDKLLKDTVFGFRTLLAKPTYSLISLLTLVIGISVTTIMFSLVNSILLKPLPLPESHQLVELNFESRSRRGKSATFSLYEMVRDADTPLQTLTFKAFDQGVIRSGDNYVPLNLIIASYDYFELYQVPALLGRWYNKDDLGKNVVVLSYDTWVQYFDQRQDIVGRSIEMNNKQYTAIGVMPAGFGIDNSFPISLWSPIETLSRPGVVYGRLKDGLSITQAQQQSQSINQILNTENSNAKGEWKVTYVSLKERLVRTIEPTLVLLSLAVSAVFLIALLNVLNLSFAHYSNRMHELSVRVSMGATRKSLVLQLLTESFILSLAGGFIGLLVAAWGFELIKVLGENQIPRLQEIGINISTALSTFGLVMVAALVTALIPAYTLVNPHKLSAALQDTGSKSTGSIKSQRIRKLLVSAEVSVAVVLLIGAGLMLRSYTKLLDIKPGFEAENVVTGHVWLPDSIGSQTEQLLHWNRLLEEVASHPDVFLAAGTSTLPMSRTGINFDVAYSYAGAPVIDDDSQMRGATRAVTDDYFDVLEIPLLEGRQFDLQDSADSSQVVIINQALADTLWSEGSPIGRQLILPDWLGGAKTIVGVVGNVKHLGLRDQSNAEFYTPSSRQIYPGMSVVAKVRKDSEQDVLKYMAKKATELNVAAPLINASELKVLTQSTVSEEKVILQLVSVFSVLAMLLASIGVYGISDNLVSQRTNEIGIRMALGAQPKFILHWVLLKSLKPVFYGLVAGVVLAVVLVRVLTAILYEVSSLDPITYLSVPVILALVGVIATWLPASRATRIHPQEALHYE
jgi:putative ABC transport system permease protein